MFLLYRYTQIGYSLTTQYTSIQWYSSWENHYQCPFYTGLQHQRPFYTGIQHRCPYYTGKTQSTGDSITAHYPLSLSDFFNTSSALRKTSNRIESNSIQLNRIQSKSTLSTGDRHRRNRIVGAEFLGAFHHVANNQSIRSRSYRIYIHRNISIEADGPPLNPLHYDPTPLASTPSINISAQDRQVRRGKHIHEIFS